LQHTNGGRTGRKTIFTLESTHVGGRRSGADRRDPPGPIATGGSPAEVVDKL